MESGLVGVAYFVMAACTAICVLSALVSWRTCKENIHLKRILHRLRYWYAELFAWNVGQGLHPPTPDPECVERVEVE